MFRHLLTTIVSASVMCVAPLAHADASHVTTEALHPFTHVAQIPNGADLNSIRFERARLVRVPTAMREGTDTQYCEEALSRDPGGSAFCPSTTADSYVQAYVVTWSFNAPPAPWDETGQTRATFDVVYKLEELSPQTRKALSAGKLSRMEAADYFAVKTSRETVQRAVIDESRSKFCDGSFVEGGWTRNNAACAETIVWKKMALPSDSIAVRVDPVL